MSTQSMAFYLFTRLDANKFLLLSFFSLTVYKDDLPESLNQTNAQWYRKSTSSWSLSLKNAYNA